MYWDVCKLSRVEEILEKPVFIAGGGAFGARQTHVPCILVIVRQSSVPTEFSLKKYITVCFGSFYVCPVPFRFIT
jgi:hypothetical protein